ncbi:MAG: dihydrofolate reductase [Bacteroidales bacterium]|jgi:dihydrofolate reductase|nr:dihydrofolate reductase [Bacteroidales bacterium]
MKNISIIAAIGKNNELGKGNQLLWHIPGDMKRFKRITSGHMVIMGRKTFHSINNKPLSNRRNIVLTRDTSLYFPNVGIVHSVDEALELVKSESEVFILGGATVYEQFLPFTHRMYLTRVHRGYNADAFFPVYDESNWYVIERKDIVDDKQAGVDYSFVTLKRRK